MAEPPLLERLRLEWAKLRPESNWRGLTEEAADRIEALEKVLDRARGTLARTMWELDQERYTGTYPAPTFEETCNSYYEDADIAIGLPTPSVALVAEHGGDYMVASRKLLEQS